MEDNNWGIVYHGDSDGLPGVDGNLEYFENRRSNRGFPNFSGSTHVTAQTNFGTQVTTLFKKSFYILFNDFFLNFKSYYIFQNRAPADMGVPTSLGIPASIRTFEPWQENWKNITVQYYPENCPAVNVHSNSGRMLSNAIILFVLNTVDSN